MALSDICKFIRATMKISQYDFADLVGTNQTEISFIERGFIPKDERKVNAIYHLYQSLTAK